MTCYGMYDMPAVIYTHTCMHTCTHKFKLVSKIVLKNFYSNKNIYQWSSIKESLFSSSHPYKIVGNIWKQTMVWKGRDIYWCVYRQAEASHTGKHPGIYRMTNNYPDTKVNSAKAKKKKMVMYNAAIKCSHFSSALWL